MTPELRAEARRVYLELLDLPVDQRAAHLERVCAGRPDLRAEVESLLRSDDEAGSFLADPSAKSVVDADATPVDDRARRASETAAEREPVGTRIGPYVLGRHLGVGGFGDVYLAEQRTPLVRTVALKIIKLGMDTRQVIARFEAERQVLAMMEHPNIARVIDAGATDKGRPYFVMEWIDGEPITTYCDRHNLSINDRLSLFSQICAAVQHAHSKGIIHRDIKPGNILVAEQDGKPVVKVIDFGIAKATQAAPIDLLRLTGAEQFIGTPAYMSPEQARGSQDIDTQSDIYSLGVVLYELLTGTTPFDSRRLKSAAYHEMLRIISEVEPPRPSNRLTESVDTIVDVAARRGLEPRRLSTTIRGELDWIVMKALEKERKRRYATATDLAADIANYLTGLPVVAVPPGKVYRAGKFVRRHRGLVGSIVLIVSVLSASTIISLSYYYKARTNEAIALDAENTMVESLIQTDTYDASDQNPDFTVRQALMARISQLRKTEPQKWNNVDVRVLERGIQVLVRNGDGDAALEPAELLVKVQKSRHAGDHRDVARALNLYGTALQDTGDIAKAEAAFDSALQMCRRMSRGDDLDVAQNLSDLALARQGLGRSGDAVPMFLESLGIYQRLLPGDHPDVATVMKNLGSAYVDIGRVDEAEPLYADALAMRRRIFGDEHPAVVISMLNLTFAKRFLQHSDEALALAKSAFDACIRHPNWREDVQLAAVESYSTQLKSLGRNNQATGVLLQFQTVSSSHAMAELATKSLSSASKQATVGALLMGKGEFVAAIAPFRKCLALRETFIDNEGNDAWKKYNAMSLLGAALVESVVAPVSSSQPVATATARPTTQNSAASQPTSSTTRAVESAVPVVFDLRRKIEMLKEAEGLLLRAWDRMKDDPNVPTAAQNNGTDLRKVALERIVRLYTVWNQVEPDKGHDRDAAHWRETLAQWSPDPTTTSAPQ